MQKDTGGGQTVGDEERVRKQWADLRAASDGAGVLLQRDYWAVLQECSIDCPDLVSLVRRRFLQFPPESLVVFRRPDGDEGPLEVGDRLDVEIKMQGTTAVRVIHSDANSFTLATVEGHPEAGRITFGAYRNDRGDVIFHIRSRARSASQAHYAGFLALGEAMQTNTWTDFIDRLAHTVGEGVVGMIHVETKKIDDEAAGMIDEPTFVAEGE